MNTASPTSRSTPTSWLYSSASTLTYHHTGKTYAVPTAKKPTTPGNVINDQTLADKKKAVATP